MGNTGDNVSNCDWETTVDPNVVAREFQYSRQTCKMLMVNKIYQKDAMLYLPRVIETASGVTLVA